LSLIISDNFGWHYYCAHRYDEAILQFKKTVEMDPSFLAALNDLGLVYLQKGMYEEAEKQFLKTMELSKTFGGNQSLAILYALSGKREESFRILNEQLDNAATEYVSPYVIAQIFSTLD
ncbi:MAG TPA: tetratricopeptide repeat protein, partial [Acidobacteriota bacterium]